MMGPAGNTAGGASGSTEGCPKGCPEGDPEDEGGGGESTPCLLGAHRAIAIPTPFHNLDKYWHLGSINPSTPLNQCQSTPINQCQAFHQSIHFGR